MKIPVICDNCLQITFKSTSRIHRYNFCSKKCKNNFNSRFFTNYNQTTNPMNMPGRTIEERSQMRKRMLKHNQSKTAEKHTYNKYLGEPEHRRIAKLKLGRDLKPNEVVHHIDGNKYNNKPSNLQVMTKSEHTSLHMKEYWRKRNDKK